MKGVGGLTRVAPVQVPVPALRPGHAHLPGALVRRAAQPPPPLSSSNREDGTPYRGRRLLAKPPPVPVFHPFLAPLPPGLVLGPDSLPLGRRAWAITSEAASNARTQVSSFVPFLGRTPGSGAAAVTVRVRFGVREAAVSPAAVPRAPPPGLRRTLQQKRGGVPRGGGLAPHAHRAARLCQLQAGNRAAGIRGLPRSRPGPWGSPRQSPESTVLGAAAPGGSPRAVLAVVLGAGPPAPGLLPRSCLSPQRGPVFPGGGGSSFRSLRPPPRVPRRPGTRPCPADPVPAAWQPPPVCRPRSGAGPGALCRVRVAARLPGVLLLRLPVTLAGGQ